MDKKSGKKVVEGDNETLEIAIFLFESRQILFRSKRERFGFDARSV
jgi:hypothetical protein